MDKYEVVIKNKARLVAQGHNQHEGVNYDETFAHVARLEAIRIFLACAAYIGFMVYQMDVRILDKALYGLKQAPRAWYQANPKESHLVAVKRIFKYLKETPNLGLWYPKGSGFDLKAYSDSDYAGCNLDRKSTSCGCHILGGKLVCWSAKKHSSMVISSVKAEDYIFKGDIELHFVPTDLHLADIFTKPLAQSSFTRLVAELGNFNPSENCVPVPPKENGKDGLATLGLFDEDHPSLSSSDLLKTFKPHHITAIAFKTPYVSEVPLTSYMPKVAKISKDQYKSLNLPSREVNADESADKETPPTKQVAKFQHAEVLVATADTTQSLDASESAKEQGNQPKLVDAEKLMDEYEKKQSDDVERSESPYDTKSEIKVVKRFQPTQTDDDDHITFLGLVYEDMETDLDKADSDLHSLPDDEVESVYGFEAAESCAKEYVKAGSKVELTQSEEAYADNLLDEMTNLNASADKRSDPFSPLLAEFLYLSTKVANLESSLAQKVTAKLEESVPRMQALPKIDQRVQETLHITVPGLIRKPLNKELNDLNTLETQRFENLLKELLSAISSKVGKFVRKYVRKEMQIVKDLLSYSAKKLDKGDVNLCVLINLMKDMVLLLDSANVFTKAKGEGEKVSLEEDMALELAEEAKAKAAKEAKIAEEAKANTQGSLNQLTRQVLKKLSTLQLLLKMKAKMSIEDARAQLEEMKRLNALKTEKEESEKVLKKKEYAVVLRTLRGGNTLTIQLPFEEEQAELKLLSKISLGAKLNNALRRDKSSTFKNIKLCKEGQGRRGSRQGMKVEVDQGYPRKKRAGRLRKGVANDVVGSTNPLGGSASLHGRSANDVGVSANDVGVSVSGMGRHRNHKGGYVGVSSSGMGRSGKGVSTSDVGGSASGMKGSGNVNIGFASGLGIVATGTGRAGISSGGVRGFDIPGLSYDMDAVNEGNQDASQANPSI
ncbi:retrovirus-related pol polyprotein from transposon TNT 1-94 [Tanacetum coccineum]